MVVGRGSMLVSDGEEHRRRRARAARLRAPAARQLGPARRGRDRPAHRRDRRTPAAEPVDVDLYELTRVLVRRVVVRVLFGRELGSRADEIGELLEPAMSYAGQPLLRQLPHPFPFTKRAEARAARRAVDRLLDEELARCRGSRSRGDRSAQRARRRRRRAQRRRGARPGRHPDRRGLRHDDRSGRVVVGAGRRDAGGLEPAAGRGRREARSRCRARRCRRVLGARLEWGRGARDPAPAPAGCVRPP